MTEEAVLKEEIASRAKRITTANPWDSAVLAREIAEKATMLKNLRQEKRASPSDEESSDRSSVAGR